MKDTCAKREEKLALKNAQRPWLAKKKTEEEMLKECNDTKL